MTTDQMEHYTEIIERDYVELCAAASPLVDLVAAGARPLHGGEIPVAHVDGKLLKLRWDDLVRLAKAMRKVE